VVRAITESKAIETKLGIGEGTDVLLGYGVKT